mmetsp:Transcript_27928/g.44982  ORF Transcript_27928/g.44982 Transcript_27928/m.44982 type:complete len:203 (-) Transcript_27928:193-801(-)
MPQNAANRASKLAGVLIFPAFLPLFAFLALLTLLLSKLFLCCFLFRFSLLFLLFGFFLGCLFRRLLSLFFLLPLLLAFFLRIYICSSFPVILTIIISICLPVIIVICLGLLLLSCRCGCCCFLCGSQFLSFSPSSLSLLNGLHLCRYLFIPTSPAAVAVTSRSVVCLLRNSTRFFEALSSQFQPSPLLLLLLRKNKTLFFHF